MLKAMNRKWVRFVLALAVIAGVGAWGFIGLAKTPAATTSDGRLSVVAAENFWGNIAGQIGGGHVSVTTMISDPGADPHLYEPNARNAAAVAGADVVVYNGLGYDDFMPKLLAAAPKAARKTVVAASASDTPNGANPHIWYSMAKVRSTAAAIEAAIEAKDTRHAAIYRDNLRKFEIDLKAVTAAQAKIAGFYSGAAVAYTERVPEYMLRDTGLDGIPRRICPGHRKRQRAQPGRYGGHAQTTDFQIGPGTAL
ncbi:MAG: hypothetical protein NVS3B29_05710 [Candidatus Saccharimonadales bacterium]